MSEPIIKVVYEVEGLQFDTFEEAKSHAQIVSLYQLILENHTPVSTADGFELFELIEVIVKNKDRVRKILE